MKNTVRFNISVSLLLATCAANALSPQITTAGRRSSIVTASAETNRCGQPVSIGGTPTATDCLFILSAGVGIGSCTPTCVCDVNGDLSTTATDALTCLNIAIGGSLPLACPCDEVPGISESFAQIGYYKASNDVTGEGYGTSIDIDGDTMVIGAPNERVVSALAGGVYVYTRSGGVWTQQAFLGSGADGPDQFGYSVSLDGDTLAVGARHEYSNATGVNGDETSNSAFRSGAVYIFTRAAGIWTRQAYIKASNTSFEDAFGHSVGLSGDTLVVGAPFEDSDSDGVGGDDGNDDGDDRGAVYVFTRSGTTWSQQAYLKSPSSRNFNEYGDRVAIDGNTIAVGNERDGTGDFGINSDFTQKSNTRSGTVWVYTRAGSTWTREANIKASNAGYQDYFASSIALDGDTLVVGADNENGGASGIDADQSDDSEVNAGAVYVFTRSGTTWTQQEYIKTTNPGEADRVGMSIDICGDKLIVGAGFERSSATGVDGDQTDDSITGAGAAYLFERVGTTWTQAKYIKSSNPGVHDNFGGTAVAIEGTTAAIGAYKEASSATTVDGDQNNDADPGAGAVYLFDQ